MLIHLSTRGGKCFVSLKSAQKVTQSKNILILTPYPSAIGSFREIIEQHVDFKGYRLFSKDDLSANTKEHFLSQNNVYFLSFQLLGDITKEKVQDFVKNVDINTIIVDETHSTSATLRSEKLLELKPATDNLLDPCCGKGAMLMYAHEKLGFPKEQLYGIDRK